MNWLDSARLSAALQGVGHHHVRDEGEAEYLFVNSCTVTAEADRKSRQIANAAHRQQKRVVVSGCASRINTENWSDNDSEYLVFPDEAQLFAHFGVDSAELPYPASSRTRLPVAIQTGCDNHCSFCITRIARGRHRTIPSADIINNIRQAQELGVNEIVLTGINLAAWGCDDTNHPEQARLGDLLQTILSQTDIPRIRLSSLGPEYLHEEFYAAFSDPRICDYLHISMQSGSASVLRRMQRGHGVGEIERIAERSRQVRPYVAIAADIIAGFPGESEAEFMETMATVRRIALSKLHVFPFSARQGTSAADYKGMIDGRIRKERAAQLRQLGQEQRSAFIHSQMGRRHMVLVEQNGRGLTTNYIRVRVDGTGGELREVLLNAENIAEGGTVSSLPSDGRWPRRAGGGPGDISQ